jgi:hypothetical protein
MRQLAGYAASLLLAACTPQTTEVIVGIASDKALEVKNFKHEQGGAYTSCTVSGDIVFDISVEPNDFSGVVVLEDVQLTVAGWKPKKEDYWWLEFDKGKPSALSFYFYESKETGDKEGIEALCRAKSSSDVKLQSLGRPRWAISAIKASLVKE